MILHMIFSTGCAGWSLGKPVSRPCALQPAHPVLKTICSNIRPELLKMGIMMPETCWAKGLLINHNLLHLVGLTCHFTFSLNKLAHISSESVNESYETIMCRYQQSSIIRCC